PEEKDQRPLAKRNKHVEPAALDGKARHPSSFEVLSCVGSKPRVWPGAASRASRNGEAHRSRPSSLFPACSLPHTVMNAPQSSSSGRPRLYRGNLGNKHHSPVRAHLAMPLDVTHGPTTDDLFHAAPF